MNNRTLKIPPHGVILNIKIEYAHGSLEATKGLSIYETVLDGERALSVYCEGQPIIHIPLKKIGGAL